ncbi:MULTISPECIES: SdpI family protein [Clostridium]|uniref:SdpI family protein n=1 Tax=Clostridium TaxID=1485 RepID=UPI0009BDB079|nr:MULTISPECIES: SdpI family protein [Clostridium]PJI08716.1 SdpI/YhfL protein family [Clostridium sp. CT7]
MNSTTTMLLIGFVWLIISLALALVHQEHITGIGYKTPFAMKNLDTWNEGNRFLGILGIILGITQIILGFIAYFHLYNTSVIFPVYTLIFVLATIFVTEIHLRKVFDKDGKRK